MYQRSWTAHHKAYKMPFHADPHGDVATEMLIYKSTVSGFLSDFHGKDIGVVVGLLLAGLWTHDPTRGIQIAAVLMLAAAIQAHHRV